MKQLYIINKKTDAQKMASIWLLPQQKAGKIKRRLPTRKFFYFTQNDSKNPERHNKLQIRQQLKRYVYN